MKRSVFGAVVALAALWAGAAAAKPTDAQKCEAAKDKAAGKYSACRLQADAKGLLKALPPDYTKCDAKQLAAWTKAENKYGGACPSSGDQGAIKTQATDDGGRGGSRAGWRAAVRQRGHRPGGAVRWRQPEWANMRDAGL